MIKQLLLIIIKTFVISLGAFAAGAVMGVGLHTWPAYIIYGAVGGLWVSYLFGAHSRSGSVTEEEVREMFKDHDPEDVAAILSNAKSSKVSGNTALNGIKAMKRMADKDPSILTSAKGAQEMVIKKYGKDCSAYAISVATIAYIEGKLNDEELEVELAKAAIKYGNQKTKG